MPVDPISIVLVGVMLAAVVTAAFASTAFGPPPDTEMPAGTTDIGRDHTSYYEVELPDWLGGGTYERPARHTYTDKLMKYELEQKMRDAVERLINRKTVRVDDNSVAQIYCGKSGDIHQLHETDIVENPSRWAALYAQKYLRIRLDQLDVADRIVQLDGLEPHEVYAVTMEDLLRFDKQYSFEPGLALDESPAPLTDD